MPEGKQPVLYVIGCGGRPAGGLPDLVTSLQSDGWTVCVISTPSGARFVDRALLAELTGYPVRVEYERPEEPPVLPLADAIAVVPATFNTINKWALGISDTLALGLLNEAIGLGLPLVAAPWPNTALARHPAFMPSVERLTTCGVSFVWDVERLPLPNSGEPGAASFPWSELHSEIGRIRTICTNRIGGGR